MRKQLTKGKTMNPPVNISNMILPLQYLTQAPIPVNSVYIAGQELCAICLRNQANEFVAQIRSCQHHFHQNCLRKWYEQGQQACPLCRNSIT